MYIWVELKFWNAVSLEMWNCFLRFPNTCLENSMMHLCGYHISILSRIFFWMAACGTRMLVFCSRNIYRLKIVNSISQNLLEMHLHSPANSSSNTGQIHFWKKRNCKLANHNALLLICQKYEICGEFYSMIF